MQTTQGNVMTTKFNVFLRIMTDINKVCDNLKLKAS